MNGFFLKGYQESCHFSRHHLTPRVKEFFPKIPGEVLSEHFISQLVKIDLNKKLDPKQNTIQTFNFDAQEFRETKNENPSTWKKELPANQCWPIC